MLSDKEQELLSRYEEKGTLNQAEIKEYIELLEKEKVPAVKVVEKKPVKKVSKKK